MKTIAATALILVLTAPAFAAEPLREQPSEPGKGIGPIVLTAAQLDGVTAGDGLYYVTDVTHTFDAKSTSDGGSVWNFHVWTER